MIQAKHSRTRAVLTGNLCAFGELDKKKTLNFHRTVKGHEWPNNLNRQGGTSFLTSVALVPPLWAVGMGTRTQRTLGQTSLCRNEFFSLDSTDFLPRCQSEGLQPRETGGHMQMMLLHTGYQIQLHAQMLHRLQCRNPVILLQEDTVDTEDNLQDLSLGDDSGMTSKEQ